MVAGKRVMDSWAHANEDSSIYELKGYAMNVLARLGVPLGGLLIKEGTNDIFSKSLSVEDATEKFALSWVWLAKPCWSLAMWSKKCTMPTSIGVYS